MRPAPLAVLALVAAACSRTPAEDFPARSSASPVASPSAAPSPAPTPKADADRLAGRCVDPTPSAASAAVPPGPAPGCPPDPEGHPPTVPIVLVDFPDSHTSVTAERVVSEHDTMRGLMYRKSMPEDRGMLFDLRERGDHPFWMHNTCIPLDLIYIDEDGLIVGIVENAPTLDDTSRGASCPSRYVLEVNAGWSRRHGVRAGQFLALPS